MKYVYIIMVLFMLVSCIGEEKIDSGSSASIPVLEIDGITEINSGVKANKDQKAEVKAIGEKKQEPLTELTKNILSVESEGITFTFKENMESATGEDLHSLSDRGGFFAILFGPRYEEELPDGEKIDILPYGLKSIEHRSFEEIESDLLVSGEENFIAHPKKEKIGNYDVVTWVKKGFCEERGFEIVGKTMNFKIESGGCHTTLKEDSDYISEFIQSIEGL